jgi:CRISPR-associated protein Cas5d
MKLDLPDGNPVAVKVWGDFACFTIPEFGVERVSYPLITPTAAVGILDAIYWKPQFHWRVVAIDVLKPVRFVQVRRNEIKKRQTFDTAQKWMNGNDDGLEVESIRTQRASLILNNVAYVIYAQAEVMPGVPETHAKFRDQLRRRVERGQCYERPFLGTREFACNFGALDPQDETVTWSQDLGPMILSVYAGSSDHRQDAQVSPIFFDALVENGRMNVPRLPSGRR